MSLRLGTDGCSSPPSTHPLLKLAAGGFAALHNWVTGGRKVIPRRRKDGRSKLTYGEVRRAAVTNHGAGTKVRICRDGSGHILPPPPYREEENLYSFDNEFQLRRLLPSLGIMTLEEWRPDLFPPAGV